MAGRKNEDDESGPERTCIVTRRAGSPDGMIRFVLAPDATVVPDIRHKLPGRGVWVTASAEVVAAAVKRKAFARGFRKPATASPELAIEVENLLVRDALQSLSMANKAGAVTTGAAKVEKAIGEGKVAALIHASDGSHDGVRKLDTLFRRHAARADAPISINTFDVEQLELALGRTNVIHAALAEGPAGHAFLSRCSRLVAYRSPAAQDREVEPTAASAEADDAGTSRL